MCQFVNGVPRHGLVAIAASHRFECAPRQHFDVPALVARHRQDAVREAIPGFLDHLRVVAEVPLYALPGRVESLPNRLHRLGADEAPSKSRRALMTYTLPTLRDTTNQSRTLI